MTLGQFALLLVVIVLFGIAIAVRDSKPRCERDIHLPGNITSVQLAENAREIMGTTYCLRCNVSFLVRERVSSVLYAYLKVKGIIK